MTMPKPQESTWFEHVSACEYCKLWQAEHECEDTEDRQSVRDRHWWATQASAKAQIEAGQTVMFQLQD